MNVLKFLKKYFFIGLLILIFVEILIIFPQKIITNSIQKDKSSVLATTDEVTAQSEQKMNGIHLVESNKGTRDWELMAVEAVGNQAKGVWNLKQVKVQFYKLDQIEFVVTGEKGNVDLKTKNLEIEGNVITQSYNGYRLTTHKIIYNSQLRKIVSPGQVRVIGPEDEGKRPVELSGDEMEIFVDSSQIFILGNVLAVQKSAVVNDYRVSSQKVELNSQKKDIIFTGDVLVKYDTYTIKSPEVFFYFIGTPSKLSKIRFNQSVFLSDYEKQASAQNLEIFPQTKKFVFTGKPKVVVKQDEIMGDEIVFLDGGKKVKVEKVKADIEKDY